VNQIKDKHTYTKENIDRLIEEEIGLVFEQVLEDCGVFKQDERGIEAFTTWIEEVLL
jgi:UDPglucose--hexose-1-phosphate uridylyltransferase